MASQPVLTSQHTRKRLNCHVPSQPCFWALQELVHSSRWHAFIPLVKETWAPVRETEGTNPLSRSEAQHLELWAAWYPSWPAALRSFLLCMQQWAVSKERSLQWRLEVNKCLFFKGSCVHGHTVKYISSPLSFLKCFVLCVHPAATACL